MLCVWVSPGPPAMEGNYVYFKYMYQSSEEESHAINHNSPCVSVSAVACT